MAYNGFAIDEYLDAAAVTRQLDELIQKPVWSIRRDKLADYVQHYFEEKCPRSKEMISQAKKVIPGGVQHNLAFNYPFPIVVTRAEGAKLYDIDGNWYYDLLQAGGPTILGSNPPAVRDQVIELLKTCGPSTGLFHEFEYKLAKKISDLVPSVEMFRMLGSGTEADMVAVRIARLKTGKKNILKMGGAYHGWSDQLAYGIRVPGTKGLLSKGVPGYVFKHTDEFFPNDLEDLERKLRANRLTGGTAAVRMVHPRLDIGAAGYHCGNGVRMEEVLEQMPEDVLTMGNIDPVTAFRNGTPASVREDTLGLLNRCAGHKNFVISSGCDIPPASSWENIDAFFAAVEEFYQ